MRSLDGKRLGFQPGNSYLHSQNPLCKLALLVLITVLAFSASGLNRQLVLFGFLMVGVISSKIDTTPFRRRFQMLLLFCLVMVLVQAFFYRQGTPLNLIPSQSLRVIVWSRGLARGIAMALRFLNIIWGSFLFIATTDPNHLAYALMQAGLPYRYGFTLVAALRFIPVFGYEMVQVRNAQMAKGIDSGSLRLRNILRYVRYTILPLVISALEKVDNLTISMEGRAFGLYEDRTYRVSFSATPRDYLVTLALSALMLTLWVAVR